MKTNYAPIPNLSLLHPINKTIHLVLPKCTSSSNPNNQHPSRITLLFSSSNLGNLLASQLQHTTTIIITLTNLIKHQKISIINLGHRITPILHQTLILIRIKTTTTWCIETILMQFNNNNNNSFNNNNNSKWCKTCNSNSKCITATILNNNQLTKTTLHNLIMATKTRWWCFNKIINNSLLFQQKLL